MKWQLMMTMAVASLVVSGCQMRPGHTMGQVGGGVVGGLLGSQIGRGQGTLWAIGAGALLGSLVGGALGSQLDAEDERQASRATTAALDEDCETEWHNPRTGHRGWVRPGRVRVSKGRRYREFTQLVEIDGKAQKVHGTAYRGGDGRWYLVSQ